MRRREATHILYPDVSSSSNDSVSSTVRPGHERQTSEDHVAETLSRITGSRLRESVFGTEQDRKRFRVKCRAFFVGQLLGAKSKEEWLSGVEQCCYTESNADGEWTVVEKVEEDGDGNSSETANEEADFDRIELESTDLEPRLGFSLEIPRAAVRRHQKIGEGAFGRVYRAMYRNRLVVYKEIAPYHYDSESGNERFIRALSTELRLLGHIGSHPNVLECYGGSIVEPNVFMLCQLMDRSLADLIYKGRDGPAALDPELALHITHDVLAGLNHLHNWKPQIVHRDIKPENILLTKRNRACVADFGLSRIKSHTYIDTENTHAGTPEYLAPEVAIGKVNEKMDIYAVGIILWECLMAQRPWEGYHPMAVFLNVSRGQQLQLPEEVFPAEEKEGTFDLMFHIRGIIERCWTTFPDGRPSCHELLGEIDDLFLALYNYGK